MPNTVDLDLSKPLTPTAFSGGTTWLDLVDPETGWKVFSLRMREGISALSRCELVIIREEPPPPPPPAEPETVFDRFQDRLNPLRQANQNIDKAYDAVRSAAGAPPGSPGSSGLGKAIDDYGKAWDGFGDQLNKTGGDTFDDLTKSRDLDDIERDFFGFTPDQGPWLGMPPPDPRAFLGTFRSVRIVRRSDSGELLHGRWITGVVSEFEDLGTMPSYWRAVRIAIVPSLFKLSLHRRSQIFQQKHALEIVEEILAEKNLYRSGSFAFDPAIASALPKREYCVQYRESDLEFVTRLLAEEGLVFTFDHEPGAERFSVFDGGLIQTPRIETLAATNALQPTLQQNDVTWQSRAGNEELSWNVRLVKSLKPEAASIRSYNFSEPLDPRPADAQKNGTSVLRIDRYPGDAELSFDESSNRLVYTSPERKAAQHDLDRARALELEVRGGSNALSIAAGATFDLVDEAQGVYHDQLARDRAYRVLSAEHVVVTDLKKLGDNAGAADILAGASALVDPSFASLPYQNQFVAIPASVPFRADRPVRPGIEGVQSAIVLAAGDRDPSAEANAHELDQILLDPLGRIKVRFHWDRRNEGQNQAYATAQSCFVRVAQLWSGAGFGSSFVPRAGMEVLVAFEDGNPDKPLVVGSVYSRKNPMPVERKHIDHTGENKLPIADKRLHYKESASHKPEPTRHLNMIRTQSHVGKGGTPLRPQGYNELSFDDTHRAQRIRLHAERDLREEVIENHKTEVEHDQVNVVQGNQLEEIKGKQVLLVKGTRKKNVDGNERAIVGSSGTGDRSEKVHGVEAVTIDKNRVETVGKTETIQIGKEDIPTALRKLTVVGNRTTTVDGNDVLEVLKDRKVTASVSFTASGNPLDMKAAKQGAAGGGSSVGVDAGGNLNLKAEGEPGEIETIAKGPDAAVLVRGKNVTLDGATAVRFEAGDRVWLEVSPDGVQMSAPKGVTMTCGAATFLISPVFEASEKVDYEQIAMGLRTEVSPGKSPANETNVYFFSMKAEGTPGWQMAEHDEDFDDKSDDEVEGDLGEVKEGEGGQKEREMTTAQGSSGAALFDQPGFLITGDDFAITAAAVQVTSKKGINIQERDESAGPVLTRRILSNTEEKLLDEEADLKKKVEELEEKLKQLEAELEEKKAAHRAKADEAKAAEDEMKAANDVLADKKKRYADAVAEREAAKKNLEEKKKAFEDEDARDENSDADVDYQMAKERLDDAEREVSRTTKERDEAQRAFDEKKRTYDEKEAARKAAEDEEKAKQAEVEQTRDELTAAREALKKKEEEVRKRTAPRTNG
jgi:type VI secretion system secreted protein VgrG